MTTTINRTAETLTRQAAELGHNELVFEPLGRTLEDVWIADPEGVEHRDVVATQSYHAYGPIYGVIAVISDFPQVLPDRYTVVYSEDAVDVSGTRHATLEDAMREYEALEAATDALID
ncbi:MAG: hypothetical protein KatS3mg051_2061 [Anaerolineae bacterium]|nr:MAG: hypothetical protein KatS3mg051_1690 [Anaerolineae bacterium]GIV82545.1 MAG: hypothetical protein KatS3mg051_1899 [Anaerolineae bacterium]GIV82707.1 MAG: hypothetical protein KatS3mg051_2061 [Anaerolineae bacterium]